MDDARKEAERQRQKKEEERLRQEEKLQQVNETVRTQILMRLEDGDGIFSARELRDFFQKQKLKAKKFRQTVKY